MAGVLLKGSPSATSMDGQYGKVDQTADQAAQPGDSQGLEPGEQSASPDEEQLLGKVMGAVFHSMNDPKKMRWYESQMMRVQPPMLGKTIGELAFKILVTIFQSASQAGTQIPTDIFFGQGGAAQQTIDRLIMLAEHAGVAEPDPDKLREDAMGALVDNVRQQFGDQIYAHSNQATADQQQQQGGGMPQAMPANPMSHAVSQGLQSQGLLSGG